MISEILAFLSLILMSIVSIYSLRKLRRFESLGDTIEDLFRYEEDEEGNPLIDARLTKMMQTLSSSLATSLRMSVLGQLSGPARLDKGLKGAMASDVVENKMPVINLLGDVFGINTSKYIAKHPDALMQLMGDPRVQQFLGSIMKGQGNNPGRNDGSGRAGYG